MSFPNTMYKPGDEVWILVQVVPTHWKIRIEKRVPIQSKVTSVIWEEEAIRYTVDVNDDWQYDCDDLYPTEEAAQEAANKTGSQ